MSTALRTRHGLVQHEIRRVWISTPEAYAEVCDLRDRAYRSAGKLSTEESFPRQDDLRNPELRILGLYHGERLVGSVQIRIPGADSLLDSVDVPLGEYPASLPPKDDILEITKLCVEPEYRGTDLLLAVFEEVHCVLVSEGRSSIVISSDERLLRKYLFLGFHRTGLSYQRRNGAPGTLEILVTRQMRLGIYGLHVGPVRWNLFLRGAARRLASDGRYPRRARAQRVLARVYGAFAPVARRARR